MGNDRFGHRKDRVSGTNLGMSQSLTKAECGNVLQRINHRKFRKRRWNFPSLLSSHLLFPQIWGRGDLGNYKKWWTKFIPHTGRLSRLAVPLLCYCKTAFPLPGFAHVVSPFSHICLNPTSRLWFDIRSFTETCLADFLDITSLNPARAVCSCSISRTKWLDASICHDPFASLCHFPLSKFNMFLQKNQSWATRVEPQDNSVETPTGHFGTSKQCRWFALVQASGKKWSSRNRNFWNLQKIEVQFASHGRWYQPSSSSCGNLRNHFCLRCRWGVWEGQLLFFPADISLTYCRKVGEFPRKLCLIRKTVPWFINEIRKEMTH